MRTRSIGLPGSPAVLDLVRDGVAAALAQRVATVTTVLVLAVVNVVVLVTTGQTAAAEAQVVARIDSAGTRLVVLSDDGGGSGMRPEAVEQVEQISDVTWAIGLGAVTDMANVAYFAGGTGVPARPFVGSLPTDIRLVSGRQPAEGEAVVGATAADLLHLMDGVGTLAPVGPLQSGELIEHDARAVPVVGVFTAAGPLASLESTVLVASDPSEVDGLRHLYVLAEDFRAVERLGAVLPEAVPRAGAGSLTVETPSGAIALREVIAGDLGATSRQLMLVVLGVGVIIVAVTVFGAVSARRREFGRRRALGSTRSAVVVVVLVQTTCAALVGVLLGTSIGVLVVQRIAGSPPSTAFVAGVAGLALGVAVVGAVPPAVTAAFRDPMRILRVP